MAAACWGDSPETPEYKPSPVENFMANAVPGDITTLSDPAFGTDVRVSMEDSFFSAAGEECKRATVRNNFNEAEIIVACRNAQGQWRLGPPRLGPGHASRCHAGFPDGRGQGLSPGPYHEKVCFSFAAVPAAPAAGQLCR